MTTTYITSLGTHSLDQYETACDEAQRQSRDARSEERVWLRDPRLTSDVLVAHYRSGEAIEVGDVPRDAVLARLALAPWQTIDLTNGDRDIAEGYDPARIEALSEYRDAGCMQGVWRCTAAELADASDDESADLGPRPDAIDWTGFAEARAAFDRAVAAWGRRGVQTVADVEAHLA